MVWAICGRMPLMMQSAPISRAAVTVLSRCWATSVSTVGTPVMSMMAISDAGLDDPLQQRLHDDLGPGAVERADHRQGQDAVPELHDRRGQLEHLLLLAADDLLAGLLEGLTVYRPSRSISSVAAHVSLANWPSRRRSRHGALRKAASSARRRTWPSRRTTRLFRPWTATGFPGSCEPRGNRTIRGQAAHPGRQNSTPAGIRRPDASSRLRRICRRFPSQPLPTP